MSHGLPVCNFLHARPRVFARKFGVISNYFAMNNLGKSEREKKKLETHEPKRMKLNKKTGM
jgi:hypothetical protein